MKRIGTTIKRISKILILTGVLIVLTSVYGFVNDASRAVSDTAKIGPYIVNLDDNFIYGISYNTSLWQFKNNIDDVKDNAVLYDAFGTMINGGTITSNMKISMEVDGIDRNLSIIINGDTDRNGTIDISDIAPISKHIISRSSLTPFDKALYDVNMDDIVDVEDIISVQMVALGNDDSTNSIVKTSTYNYSYDTMVSDISTLVEAYPAMAQSTVIGTTQFGRDIYAVTIGNKDAPNSILIHGAIHAREHMTSMLIMDQIEYLLTNTTMLYNDREISDYLKNTKIHFIPMVNPDGVMLVQQGIDSIPPDYMNMTDDILAMSDNGNFSTWKANATGIDLNRNFDASYGDVDNQSPGASIPAFSNFGGYDYFTELESMALRDYTIDNDFAITISYHSTGEEIYWYYNQNDDLLAINYQLACTIGYHTGYKVLGSDMPLSTSGYKDWAIEVLDIPSLTIETGNALTPLPYSQYRKIWAENKTIPLELISFSEVYSR